MNHPIPPPINIVLDSADLALHAWAAPFDLLRRAPSPTLVVALERVRHNVDAVLARTGVDRWRPHVKTVKTPELLAPLLERGVRAFKCATVREARMLATMLEGTDGGDVLVAFPHVGPNLARLGELARRSHGVRWSIVSEDPAHAADIPHGFGIYVDVNSGMDRTGAPLADEDRILAVAAAAGARLRGVHAYDGHRTEDDAAARAAAVVAGNDRVRALVDRLREAGHAVDEVVTAGTPAFPSSVADPGWDGRQEQHRVSPGTVVLGDLRSLHQVPEIGLQPAAFVLARVVSRPAEGVITVDAGSKALSADVDPVGLCAERPGLVPRRPSEEHLPLDLRAGTSPAPGDPLLFVPGHVCPTVNLHSTLALVEPGGEWRVVDVAARGHDGPAAAQPS